MHVPLIPGVPPQALPVALIGWLAVRNFRRRNMARISGRASRSRRSSTQGMDGEEVTPSSRRNRKGSRTILRR